MPRHHTNPPKPGADPKPSPGPKPAPKSAPKPGPKPWGIVLLAVAATACGHFSAEAQAKPPAATPPAASAGAAAAAPASPNDTAPAERGPSAGVVVHIVDGDTLDVDIAGATRRIRLIGIDTPESKKPDTPVECFALEAAQRLRELVPPGTRVVVLRDAETIDAYDRLLAYVFRADDDAFVNLVLVAEGYAVPLSIAPNTTFAADFAAAAATARRARIGLWAACPVTTTRPTLSGSRK